MVAGEILETAVNGLRSPKLAARKVNVAVQQSRNPHEYNPAGIDIFAEDWDNLLVLDACRHDMFQELVDLPGTLSKKISRGSNTVEFLRGNIQDRELLDTVYVVSNPQYSAHKTELNATFHDVLNLWETEWDEHHETVLPEDVTDAAIDAAEKYPKKRLVIHYIQPHIKFIGEFGRQLNSIDPPIWYRKMQRKCAVSDADLWKAYNENLERALPAVKRLVAELTGKTVVTSDHGNLVGERAKPLPVREYGHPEGLYHPELVTVPWLEIEGDTRREITAARESVTSPVDGEDGAVEHRLEQLGYLG